MDTTKTITHVSLCARYGGIDLGLSRAIPNLRTIAFSEIEAFACANLVAKMEAGLLDAAPIWTNLKTFPWSGFCDRVDILSGGYPCQPFSAAGKRLGTDDPRHLWPFIADGIRAMRPRICFFENVEGHISLGLRAVIQELEGLGYATTWGIFSAREVGAPHQRKRVFILAYNKSIGIQGHWSDWIEKSQAYARQGIPLRGCDSRCSWPSRPGEPQHGWEPPRVVGNAKSRQDHGRESGELAEAQGQRRRGNDAADSASEGVGDTQHDGLHGAASSRGYEADAGRSEEESEMEQQRQRASGLGSELCTSVGDAEGIRSTARRTEQQGWNTSGRSSEESGAVGNTSMLDGTGQAGGQWETQTGRTDTAWHSGKAQPSMGGDADGSADWMDHAELYVTSNNRTDELRLLGNGVVPATAERAFLTLMNQLLNQ